MSRSPFYAIDQEHLPERYWDLADVFADLRSLSASVPAGVRRITVADLRVLVDCCSQVPDDDLTGPQRNAIARVRGAIEMSASASD